MSTSTAVVSFKPDGSRKVTKARSEFGSGKDVMAYAHELSAQHEGARVWVEEVEAEAKADAKPGKNVPAPSSEVTE